MSESTDPSPSGGPRRDPTPRVRRQAPVTTRVGVDVGRFGGPGVWLGSGPVVGSNRNRNRNRGGGGGRGGGSVIGRERRVEITERPGRGPERRPGRRPGGGRSGSSSEGRAAGVAKLVRQPVDVFLVEIRRPGGRGLETGFVEPGDRPADRAGAGRVGRRSLGGEHRGVRRRPRQPTTGAGHLPDAGAGGRPGGRGGAGPGRTSAGRGGGAGGDHRAGRRSGCGRSAPMRGPAVGGSPTEEWEYPRLHNLVDGLCATMGLPRPTICVVEAGSRTPWPWGGTRTRRSWW